MTSQWPPVTPEFDPPAPSAGGTPQPGYPQAGYPQAGYPQPYFSQPGYSQPGYSQPGYPPLPYAGWNNNAEQPQRPRPDYGFRRDVGLAVLIVAALAVAGVGAGLLWHAVSARPTVVESAGGGFGLPADTDKNYFGAEASFFAVTAAAGFACGVIAWLLGRRRGPAIAIALAVGSVVAGLLARAIGEAQQTNATLANACGKDAGFDGICAVYNGHLQLRVVGLTLTWAIASMAVFLTLSAIGGRGSGELERWPATWEALSPMPYTPLGSPAPPAGYASPYATGPTPPPPSLSPPAGAPAPWPPPGESPPTSN